MGKVLRCPVELTVKDCVRGLAPFWSFTNEALRFVNGVLEIPPSGAGFLCAFFLNGRVSLTDDCSLSLPASATVFYSALDPPKLVLDQTTFWNVLHP